MSWDSGDAWQAYPIVAGEVWAVGPHRLACGDIEAGDALRLLDLVGDPDFTYTVPPRGATEATRFRVGAGLPRGGDFWKYSSALFDAVARTRHDVVWVMGWRWNDTTRAAAAGAGLVERGGPVEIVREGSKTATINHVEGQCGALVPDMIERLRGRDDRDTPFIAAAEFGRQRPGAIVFDPCVRQGLTSVAADTAGLRAVCLELHPWRAADALLRLRELVDDEPARVASL